MDVLIVETNAALGALWRSHLERMGARVELVATESDATDVLRNHKVDVIVADLDLPDGAAMAVADYAAYRQPDARVVFVTSSSFFSEGDVFNTSPNAFAFLPTRTAPDDLATIVAHHGELSAKR